MNPTRSRRRAQAHRFPASPPAGPRGRGGWRILTSVRKEASLRRRLSDDDYDLDHVVASYWDPVLQWIRSTGKVRGGEADEVRQEVFLRVTREITAGRRYGLPLGAAIFQITNWTLRGYVADAARRREREQPVGDHAGDEPVDVAAVAEIDQVGHDDVVRALFARLGDREGTLMTLHYLEGLDLAEVAEALGITANNAHQIHHRAKKRIHTWLVEGDA